MTPLVFPRSWVQLLYVISLLLLMITMLTWMGQVQGAMINQNENKFNHQWSSGIWDYQDQVPAERLRNAAIGAVLVQKYAAHPANCSILEVGCGEGAITDFLTPSQKLLYEGVDISEKAVAIANTKRGQGGMVFTHANMLHRVWTRPVDVVICSEVVYYTEHEIMIDRFLQMLRPLGVLIISLHQPNGKNKGAFDNIFTYAESKFTLLDVIEVGGRKHPPNSVEMTQFRIKVLQVTANHTTSLNTSHQMHNHTDSSVGSRIDSSSNNSSSAGNSISGSTIDSSISNSTASNSVDSTTSIIHTSPVATATTIATATTLPTVASRNITNKHHMSGMSRRNGSANGGHGHGQVLGHGQTQGQGLAHGSGKGFWSGLGTGPPDFKRG